ncbi:hypothetical protein UFOVP208_5 [uncultured Caudovirales phage]|uniref:Uncharacterized protein n=1 Tax=uncultured Caudovirales phage TaxID=2100421 RepID=A0A6J7WLN9_9CAUD|nr:hypothetical protein UFOVP208_5 [uncultured Caudovirales phage]
MNQESKLFLDENRRHYETLTKAGFVQHLSSEVRETYLRIIRENFSPGYLCCLHCSADIAKMIEYVYTQFDKLPKEVEPVKSKTKKK